MEGVISNLSQDSCHEITPSPQEVLFLLKRELNEIVETSGQRGWDLLRNLAQVAKQLVENKQG